MYETIILLIRNLSFSFIWVLLITVTTSSCSTSLISDSTSSRRPYDYESTTLHAEVTPFFHSDTLTVFVQINRNELLYTREADNAPFIAEVEVTFNSQKWLLIDTLLQTSTKLLNEKFDLKNSDDELDNYWLKYTIKDLHRNSSLTAMREIDRAIAWNISDNWPIYDNYSPVGSEITIISDDNITWNVSHVIPINNLPAPPFSSYRNPLDTLTALSHSVISGNWTVLNGCQVFTSPNNEISLTLHGRTNEFPELKNVRHLIESTRYIATRSEFSSMVSDDHPKEALDEFWLSCGNSPERTKKLIKTYYSRVEEANASFSGLQEGWRTDRGMVHIIYGVPNRIRRDYWTEVWTYGEEGTSNTLTFRFRRGLHDLDNNRYRLERNNMYRSSWDRMITSWRNGRVQHD